MKRTRSYLPATREAATLLGTRVRLARRERHWTLQQLADRVGATPATIRRVERGDPTVGLGVAFDTASLVGVVLFDGDDNRRTAERAQLDARLALLPASVRPSQDVDDAF